MSFPNDVKLTFSEDKDYFCDEEGNFMLPSLVIPYQSTLTHESKGLCSTIYTCIFAQLLFLPVTNPITPEYITKKTKDVLIKFKHTKTMAKSFDNHGFLKQEDITPIEPDIDEAENFVYIILYKVPQDIYDMFKQLHRIATKKEFTEHYNPKHKSLQISDIVVDDKNNRHVTIKDDDEFEYYPEGGDSSGFTDDDADDDDNPFVYTTRKSGKGISLRF